jgi:hypothetical protein
MRFGKDGGTMHTLLCHELLVERDREGLIDPDRSRIATLATHASGKHLECPAGHKVHLAEDGECWPCDWLLASHHLMPLFRQS